MPKDEWGTKRLCPHCTSRFYDLKRDPMTCPECGHSFTAESLVMTRGRTMIAEKAVVKERDIDLDDLADDTDLDETGSDTDLDDDLLDDDEDDNVSLDDIADVGGGEDDA
ncbi:MAG: TIGR02300 family protein [Paracoccaceae bacterium]